MGAGGQALVSKTFNVFDTLPLSVSSMVLTMAGAGKNLKLRRGYSSGTGSVSPFVIRPYDMRSYVKVMVPRPVKTLYVPYNSCQCLGMRGLWKKPTNQLQFQQTSVQITKA